MFKRLIKWLTGEGDSGQGNTEEGIQDAFEREALNNGMKKVEVNGEVKYTRNADHFDRYYEAYQQAEELRKAGKGSEAEEYYQTAIDEAEKDKSIIRNGVPPAPYRQFAKMLYHMQREEEAVAVLDRYLDSEYGEQHAERADDDLRELQERLSTGDFRQLKNKYT